MTLTAMKYHLEAGEIEGFLDLFESCPANLKGSTELTWITQVLLPAVLKTWLLASAPRPLLRLWSLIRSTELLVVDNELLAAINERLDPAWIAVCGSKNPNLQKLIIFSDSAQVRLPKKSVKNGNVAPESLPMRRVVIHSNFIIGDPRITEKHTAKRNVCYSRQEREFLKAVRLFLPGMMAYPNVPLRNFIDADSIAIGWSRSHHRYSLRAEVDVLICTQDEDPIAGIELDSIFHDDESAVNKDALKDEIFSLAGIPLIRIRADNTRDVRAEDFYELLRSQHDLLERFRPTKLRPRRDHDHLIPE